MVVITDAFAKFARRMAFAQGNPYIIIAETPEPFQDSGPDELRERAEKMIASVIDYFTLPSAELERRLKEVAQQQIRPSSLVRSSVPV